MLGSKEEAEEVVQDTFVKVHQGIDKFRDEASFGAWVFRISHNLCLDNLRNKKRKKEIQLVPFPTKRVAEDAEGETYESGMQDIADDSLEPAQKLDVKEESEVLAQSLRSLPEVQRAVLVLHDIEGFQYQEIAKIIGASIGTVRSRLHYGRLKMKELMDAYYSSKNLPITPR